jgi:three-Cys-motif partner protein
MVRDAMCGSGENKIHKDQAPLDSSPLSLLKGAADAAKKCKLGKLDNLAFKFSDVRPQAIAALDENLRSTWLSLGLQCIVDSPRVMTAREALSQDMAWLSKRNSNRLITVLDPNGPLDLPYSEVRDLITYRDFHRKADIVVNIAATAMKRVRGSAKAAGRDYSEVCGQFCEVFLTGTEPNDDCWIRQPLESDPWQWCVLAYWAGKAPNGAWKNQRFVKFHSEEGERAIQIYTNTRKGISNGR